MYSIYSIILASTVKHPDKGAASKLGIYKGIHNYTAFLCIHIS